MNMLVQNRDQSVLVAFGGIGMSLDRIGDARRDLAQIRAVGELMPGRVEDVARIFRHHTIKIAVKPPA